MNETIEKLLLTPKQMAEVYEKVGKEGSSPYFYKITNGKRWLYFVGAKHAYDPKDKQTPIILKFWEEFLEKTKKVNCIALVEGGKPPVPKSLEEGIEKYNGPGMLTFLAHKEKIKTISPEPGWINEIKILQKEFSKDEIMYADYARTLAQWNRLTRRPDPKKYVMKYMNRNKRFLKWKGYDFSFEHFVKIHNKTHDHNFDENNYDCFHHDSSPNHNPVSAASSKNRDTFVVKEILKFWGKGKNIFIIYGSGHAITQEKALKKLLK